MITKRQAIDIAVKTMREVCDLDEDVSIVAEATLDKEYGWIFFYNTLKFIETGESRYALAGNSPIVVEKKDGRVTILETSRPIEDSIKSYERNL